MKITLQTSGSTGKPKYVTHNEENFYKPAKFLAEKWKLNSDDIILNAFPAWTIAHWAFCFFPAQITNCKVININFEPFKFWKQVKEIKPTTMTLAIGTLHTMLKQGKPDLSFMKNLSTGSAPVTNEQINMMRNTGAKQIWNIYGSTECIPPVMISHNLKFNFNETPYNLEYKDTLIVDGFDTEDKFVDNQCLGRTNLNKTWKS